ncbi:MAG: DUF1015 domain-containing protein [Clostridiaceae bacterium]|nr:DUF1015 domain-containing protein [Clostridiaceae bacterium]
MPKWDGIVTVPDVLLPARDVEYAKWAVVACDQFTSAPAYWQEAAALVGESPSALSLVLPEVYLAESPDRIEARIADINQQMEAYLRTGVLTDTGRCAVLTRRSVPGLADRTGLVLAIDLERYEYEPGNTAPIRSSEGTVLERIPPRVRIRENAPLELPHVQLLSDDPDGTVLDPLLALCDAGRFDLLYDTPLMLGGGWVKGWRIPAEDPALEAAFDALFQLPSWREHKLLLAVGDGNHSLVTAKACWERIRPTAAPGHPARYAMVELINLHDPGLVFEPIHRVLFRCSSDTLLAFARDWFAGPGVQDGPVEVLEGSLAEACANGAGPDGCTVSVVGGPAPVSLRFPPSERLAVDRLQPMVDALANRPGITVDYIHGDDALRALAGPETTGILMPSLPKSRFFKDIATNGVYPRKTFSTGEAEGKRYYIEARRIR